MGYQLGTLPTPTEKDALAGTSGSPSNANPYASLSDIYLNGTPFGGTGSIALGTNTVVTSTSNVALMQLNVGLVNPSVGVMMIVMVNAGAVGQGGGPLFSIGVQDESLTDLGVAGTPFRPWANLLFNYDTEASLIFTQFVPAGVSKTYYLVARVNSGGQSVLFNQFTSLGVCW